MARLPEPPRPDDLDPLIAEWPAERPFFRIHERQYAPCQFNASGLGQARFSPLTVDGRLIPTLYGADCLEGALSESVFRFVATGHRELRARRVLAATLANKAVSRLAVRRTLRLLDLRGFGLGGARVPISRAELIESAAAHYPETRLWAAAFYRHGAAVDGFLWISRQYDRAECFMLFGDRVGDGLYELDPPQPLLKSGMLIEVLNIARLAKIDIISSGYPGG